MKLPKLIAGFYNKFVESSLRFFRKFSRDDSTEEEIKRMQDLAVLGHIVASIEHDVGHSLAILHIELSLLKREAIDNPKIYKRIIVRLEEIEKTVLSIDRIICLLRFVRIDSTYLNRLGEKLSLTDLINRAIRNVKIESNTDSQKMFFQFNPKYDIYVGGYSEMLEQGLTNILKNSVEAQNYAGSVKVQLSINKLAQEAIIEIKDSGGGIEDEIISVITKPGFTTKSEKNGLGLFISEKIIKIHHGKLNIESNLGKGTIVSISLPIYEKVK